MALMIADGRTGCAARMEDCPQQAMDKGDAVYAIDGAQCLEWEDEPRCVAACPVERIVPAPAPGESREEFAAKTERRT